VEKKYVNPVTNVRHEEVKKVVKLDFVASLVNRFYSSLGEFLYEKGYLSEMADSDKMTGLYNRNFFDRWVEKVIAQAKRTKVPLSFVYIDINDLKMVNDTLGHKEGDRMLNIFSKKLLTQLRVSDLCFRMGGDEFAVLMWSCNKENADIKMAEIQSDLLDKDNIGFSFGVAEVKGKTQIAGAIKKADERMYEMKKMMKKGRVR
jgi:diguanylate cyclase (GGDEF)-like protein